MGLNEGQHDLRVRGGRHFIVIRLDDSSIGEDQSAEKLLDEERGFALKRWREESEKSAITKIGD